MSTPNSAAKTGSSRLLTMKFMQRASAASPGSNPSTPTGPPSKKQRLGNGSDALIVQEALAAEEAKRQQALDRQAADAGETKWVLSYQDKKSKHVKPPMRIVSAGFAAIDSARPSTYEEEDEDDNHGPGSTFQGRRSFGKFNRTVERLHNPDLSSSSEEDSSDSASASGSEDEDDDFDDDDPTGTNALISQSRKEAAEKIRAERKAKKKADKVESSRMAAERRSKEVKLNGGISIGGAGKGSNRACFECGQTSHERRDCPRKQRSQGNKRAPPT